MSSSRRKEEITKTSNHLQVFGTPEMVNEDTMLSPKVSLIQFSSFSFVQTLKPVVDSPTVIYCSKFSDVFMIQPNLC
jgi:hypothetical protein